MFKKTTSYLTNFLELQLVISLISLPVLIHWGLAVSYMTPLANMIFTPLLTVFLCCSSIFVLCTLACIPTTLFSWCLENISNIWFYILAYGQPDWLIGFSYQMLIPSILVALCILYLYTYHKPKQRTALFFLTGCCFLLFLCNRIIHTSTLKQINDLPLFIGKIQNKIYLFDHGALCSKRNFYQWIDYTILPSIVKKTGITTIDTLVLYKPSKNIVSTIKQFSRQTNVSTIFATTTNCCYQQLKKALEPTNIKVFPIKKAHSKKSTLLKSKSKILY